MLWAEEQLEFASQCPDLLCAGLYMNLRFSISLQTATWRQTAQQCSSRSM